MDSQDGPRQRLISAGLDLVDGLPLPKVFAGATTAGIARAGGVTTGSFFHHFANHAEFVDALALTVLPERHDLTEQVDELVDSLSYMDLLEILRSNLHDTWEVQSRDETMQRSLRLQMELWAHHPCELSTPVDGLHTVADVLRRESVAASDVAEAAGVSNQTVLNLFDSVREVAANTFVRHVPTLLAVAQSTRHEEPLDSLYQVLDKLAELAAADPEPARALLEERTVANLRGGELLDMDIRLEVPIVQAVLPSVERMDLDGIEPIQVAAMLCSVTLTMTLDRIGPARDVAALVMRMLPTSATGVVPWQPRGASDRTSRAG
jgi:AcrR family transcriptional regulator